jgi:hypothetical protein
LQQNPAEEVGWSLFPREDDLLDLHHDEKTGPKWVCRGESISPPCPIGVPIIATTGFRPDLSLLQELRLALDAGLESPVRLAPLIDPNVHSCGTVPPHGVEELSHPEANFYIVGMKSYGRAPTFLTLTGYEQVRSIVAALTGDWEAARQVELVLPETGVCSSGVDGSCAVPSTLEVAGQDERASVSASFCTPPARHRLPVGTARKQAE